MGISFAGQDLLLVPPELQDWLDHYLPLQESVLFGPRYGDEVTNRRDSRQTNSPRKVGIGRPNYPDAPPLKINALYWPTGATRYSRFVGLCNDERLDSLVLATSTPVDEGGGPSIAGTLTLTDDSSSAATVSTAMYLLPPRRIVPPLADVIQSRTPYMGAWGLWLIPLVDERYFWQFCNTFGISLSAGDSWSELFSHLSGCVGSSITPDTIHSDYLYPDPLECSRKYESAAALLDAASHSVGQRIVRSLDGAVRSMGFEAAENALENTGTGTGLADGVSIAGGVSWAPYAAGQAEVALVTTKYVSRIQACDVYEWEEWSLNGSRGVPRTIHSTLAATFDNFTDSSPTNQDDIVALTERLATDHRLQQRYYDHTSYGLQQRKNNLLLPWDDHVEFSVGRWHERFGYLAQTRYVSQPYNFGIDEMLHQIADRVLPAGNYVAKTTSEITALASTTPGSGTAEVYVYDGSNNLVTTGVEITVYNTTASTVADDKWIQVKMDAYCRPLVDVADCDAA